MSMQKRTQSRYKKAKPLTASDVRKFARKIGDISRYVDNWADDMDGAGIEEIQAIVQGIETYVHQLEERVTVEFRDRIEKAVREKARKDADEFG